MTTYLQPCEPTGPEDPIIAKSIRVTLYLSQWNEFKAETKKSFHPMGRYVGFLIGAHVKDRLEAIPKTPNDDDKEV